MVHENHPKETVTMTLITANYQHHAFIQLRKNRNTYVYILKNRFEQKMDI